MEHTVTRGFDVSHVSLSCEACGEFGRFVNERVLEQFEAFEADPPEALPWADLDRMQKLVVAEGVARRGRSVEEFVGRGDADRDDAGTGGDPDGTD